MSGFLDFHLQLVSMVTHVSSGIQEVCLFQSRSLRRANLHGLFNTEQLRTNLASLSAPVSLYILSLSVSLLCLSLSALASSLSTLLVIQRA